MKKTILSGLTLLSIVTLAACSSGDKKATTTETTAEKTTQTTVETTVATSETKEIKASTASYLTDEAIEAIQTVSDYKNSFKSLMDTYVKDFDDLIAQLPENAQKILEPQRDQLVSTFDRQYKALEKQFVTSGISDDTVIPQESREELLSGLKSARDMLKSTMESTYKQAQDILNQ